MEVDIKTVLEECKSLSDLARFLFGKENYTNREKCKVVLADNGVDWMEWLNIKKQKTKHYCLNCGKELTGDYRKKFCNHSCAASYNNRGVVITQESFAIANVRESTIVKYILKSGRMVK